ncbi:sulfotransferase [Phenylobacterium sp. LjRoot219]|uniref:sulfotransferase family protein n=1 Tax=Phenylobacterium sp. LjRoot219 TaxID=3342283 RepID=UPI003ECEE744
MSSQIAAAPPGAGDLASVYAAALRPYTGPLAALTIMAEAEQATGLSNWGGERWDEFGFRRRLEVLCRALETEANLTPTGRSRAHGRVLALLISRLRVLQHRRGWTVEPQIRAPLVGTGLPRSGTSFLQALLAQDPDTLVPITGHAMVPVPPPGELADETERMALVDRMLRFQGLDAPEVNAIHPFAPEAEDEDVLFQEAACGSLIQAFFNVPSFAALLPESAPEFYAWQKGMMQLVQGERSEKRWVLKAPEYMSHLETLTATYPGSMIFVNHRDPAKVVASIASLYVTFQGLNSTGAVDPKHLGPPMLAGQMASVAAMSAWRAANPQAAVVDVHYQELVADPIGQVERLYAAFGLDLTAKARMRMEAFLKVNRHGQSQAGVKHRYQLEDFGLTEDLVEAACAAYLDQYGVSRERAT